MKTLKQMYRKIKPSFFWIGIFIAYCIITLIIFNHRLPHITTQYGMPDIDTDGGLWYQWLNVYSHQHGLMPEFTNFIAYPFGLDLSYNPFPNLIYTIHAFILEHIIGFSWQNLMLVTNISSLSTYPLAAIGAAFLGYYLTKNKYASFLVGIVYSFTFYHLLSGRGEMSINHIELIPIYLLSLFYFLDKRSVLSLVISGATFGILFNSDAYYAFFSGIFSLIIVLLYKKESWLSKAKTYATYYPVIFIFLILINFEFILSNLFLLNHGAAVATGRNSIARSELTDILFYFSAVEGSLFHYIPVLGNFIFIIVPFLYISGALWLRKSRLYVTILACVVVTMVLTTYVPFFYWIDELYFRYFGIFRGIGKMIMPGYLFIGILLGVLLTEFMKSKIGQRLKRTYFILGYTALCAIVLLGGLTTDVTWYRNGNFEKAAKFYEPIKNNQTIHAVAVYPMRQNNVLICPQPYSEIGQILNNKSLACGASPFDPYAKAHYENISDITKPETIDYLTKYNTDTIFIYNEIQTDSMAINKLLHADARLTFVGRFVGQKDNSYYISANDYSRDISVYQINKVVADNQNPKPLLSFQQNGQEEKVKIQKVNPYTYVIDTGASFGKGNLVFRSPFSAKWEIYSGDYSNTNDLFYFLKKPMTSAKHIRYNEFQNAWQITTNANSHVFTLYFKPHAFSYLGIVMSTATVLAVAAFLAFSLVRKRKRNI